MIRVVVFLGLVCLVALGMVWLADRPGEVAITWLGWRIESSVLVLL
ncbi:MAG: heme biosynthesis protein HemY, partial [Alphaproteobacteria bacterium]